MVTIVSKNGGNSVNWIKPFCLDSPQLLIRRNDAMCIAHWENKENLPRGSTCARPVGPSRASEL